MPVLSPHTRQAVRVLTACAIADGAAWLLGAPEPYWSLITAIVVMQPDISHTWTAGRDRVLATLVGATLGLLLIACQQQGLPKVPLFVAGLVPLAFLTASRPAMRMAGVTLVVVLLIPSAGNPYGRAFARVLNILLGAVACLLVSLLIAPKAAEPQP
jgi:uncharacterized membrane protein YccC